MTTNTTSASTTVQEPPNYGAGEAGGHGWGIGETTAMGYTSGWGVGDQGELQGSGGGDGRSHGGAAGYGLPWGWGVGDGYGWGKGMDRGDGRG